MTLSLGYLDRLSIGTFQASSFEHKLSRGDAMLSSQSSEAGIKFKTSLQSYEQLGPNCKGL